ncbi:MAG: TdeIII family type II restriction endonuclease [Luteolibacter sp.]
MRKQERINEAIKNVVTDLMDRVMQKVTVIDPFIKEEHRLRKPLYAALVPDEIFKGSHFERRFVTPFGGVWEKLAEVVATEFHGKCTMGHRITGMIGKESLRRIQEVLQNLEHKEKGKERSRPDWSTELSYIRAGGGKPIPVDVVCDIYVENQESGSKYAFELKGPLPNSDQTKVSKEKMFKLLAMSPRTVDGAYYALPYNPYGKKEDYAWTFPARWFDMKADPSVLIGGEFWDLIGGNGTYANFICEVNKLGKLYRERIYTEYLGIAIPEEFEDDVLR